MKNKLAILLFSCTALMNAVPGGECLGKNDPILDKDGKPTKDKDGKIITQTYESCSYTKMTSPPLERYGPPAKMTSELKTGKCFNSRCRSEQDSDKIANG